MLTESVGAFVSGLWPDVDAMVDGDVFVNGRRMWAGAACDLFAGDLNGSSVSDGNDNFDGDDVPEPPVRVKARYVDPWVRVPTRAHVRWDKVRELYEDTEDYSPQNARRVYAASQRKPKAVK